MWLPVDQYGSSGARRRRSFGAGRAYRSPSSNCEGSPRATLGGRRCLDSTPLAKRSFGSRLAREGQRCAFGSVERQKLGADPSHTRLQEALARVVFNIAPTCIDVNQHTASHAQIDVLVGFSNGDIFWFGARRHLRCSYDVGLTLLRPTADPLTAKYTRLNKSGIITSSRITSVLWLPPSPAYSSNDNHCNLFLTSHADGTMLVWDKDREDWSGFTPTAVPSGLSLRNLSGGGGSSKENEWVSSAGDASVAGSESKHAPVSAGSLPAGMGDIVVSRPAPVDKKGGATTKFNPVSHWRVSKKAITGESSALQCSRTVADAADAPQLLPSRPTCSSARLSVRMGVSGSSTRPRRSESAAAQRAPVLLLTLILLGAGFSTPLPAILARSRA